MKFTEGYWEKNERANAQYASQAFIAEKMKNGMRIIAPFRPVLNRADALDVGTITIEFTSAEENVIAVRSFHFEGYDKKEPYYEKYTNPQPVEVVITDEEAVMKSGAVTVRVNRKEWGYRFEAEGKVLTGCNFKNLGYMQYDRKALTKFPEENYMKADYKPYMMTELSLQPGECIYGLGERFTAFVKNGQSIDIWNEDGGTASQIAYKNIPFYMTNRHYGIFVDHSDLVSFEVASEKVEYVGFSTPGEELRYQLIYGKRLPDILDTYTKITGRPALPPAWSFGLWLSTSFTTNYDEETTNAFIQGMVERQIPISVFHFDCFWMKEFHWSDFEWDDRTFPDVSEMLKRYKEKGLKISVWINPYIAQGTEFFKEGMQKGYLLKRADGMGIKQIDNWQPGMGLVDFTNPDAAHWYTAKLKTLLDAGVDCFKTDFGERIPVDVIYYNGADAKSMHNYYTFLYNKEVFELLKEVKGEKEAVLFARSATAGCQQFPVHWGGDCSANYPSMAETLRGGLSFAMSGFSFWSHDIGGFENTASPDLYKRWLQFGLLSTHSRLHGSKTYRVPWLFDEEASEVARIFTKLKCRLMPYLYRCAIKAKETGLPVMRPMILEFEEDPAVPYLDMQYMLGDKLLVAPIFSEDGIVNYYLPRGEWTHLLSGEVKQGGCWYTESYDYLSLPLYVRGNTLLPLGACKERPDYNYEEAISIRIYQLRDGVVTCQIPNCDGEIALEIEAEKKGSIITLTASKTSEKMTYLLMGIYHLESYEACSIEDSQQGIKITPVCQKITIHL